MVTKLYVKLCFFLGKIASLVNGTKGHMQFCCLTCFLNPKTVPDES